jgi:hypothetical protein
VPIVIAIAVIVSFPWTSTILFCGTLFFAFWRARKNCQIAGLLRQRYLDEVAAFRWSDDISPVEFEQRCAEAMRLAGWSAQTTKASSDQGVDVIAVRSGIRVVLQCKRYNKSVGNKAVQEAFAAKTFANTHYAAVVTNSQYTSSAIALSEKTGVLLLHFTDLTRPNQLFGFPDAVTVYHRSGVTDASIKQAKESRVNPRLITGFGLALLVAVLRDSSQLHNTASTSELVATVPAQPVAVAKPVAPQPSETIVPPQMSDHLDPAVRQ